MGEQAPTNFLCPDCPAEIVLQNISRHRGLDPSANGTVLFGVLVSKNAGPVSEIIRSGATTLEEVVDQMEKDSSGWSPSANPDRMHGDLTKAEITYAAIGCMLRKAFGECPLK